MGPPAAAIRGMGDKLESKRLASKAGVHIVRNKGFLGTKVYIFYIRSLVTMEKSVTIHTV